jgi:hypothetical protein
LLPETIDWLGYSFASPQPNRYLENADYLLARSKELNDRRKNYRIILTNKEQQQGPKFNPATASTTASLNLSKAKF